MTVGNAPLHDADPEVFAALERERERQTAQIELVASENIASRAVLEALGHEINNKTLEGYPGKRFHGGGENVDIVEQLAIERARKLFGAEYVNVQPHSGTQANQAVLFALAGPGSRILSLDLAAGGHLSHGSKAKPVRPLVRGPPLRRQPGKPDCWTTTQSRRPPDGYGRHCSSPAHRPTRASSTSRE